MVLLVFLALGVRRRLLDTHDPVIPSDRITLVNIFELLIEFVMGLSDSIIGPKGATVPFPLRDLLHLHPDLQLHRSDPGFSPPTSDLNITLGLGLVSFGAYHYFGIREHGSSYVKQFMGPFLLIAPLFFLIEMFSHMFRPLTLGLRLAFNMFADHLVVGIFTDLTYVVIPVLFYLLGRPGLGHSSLRFHTFEHDLCILGSEP